MPWLKGAADISWGDAVHYGFRVFIVEGVAKAVLAGVLTPAAWRAVQRVDERP